MQKPRRALNGRHCAVYSTIKRRILIPVAIIGALTVVGTVPFLEEARAPLPDDVKADAIVVEKSIHRMSLFKDGELIRSYSVALGRGGPEPKSEEGDARTPQGTYVIDSRNRRSSFHRALHVSYPDATDVAAARARGVNAGSDVMIHGIRKGLGWLGRLHRTLDWTAGCIAVTNREIDEVWRVVPNGTPITIKP
jgi:murein L,D-transpeptidase YafK